MRWGEAAGRAFDAWAPVLWPALLTAGGGVVGSVGLAGGMPESGTAWGWTIVGGCMVIGGAIPTGRAAHRVQGHSAALAGVAGGMRKHFGVHGPSAMRMLHDLQRAALGPAKHSRLSLFAPVEGGGFKLVARFSEHHRLRNSGERTVYPPDEGLVARAWLEGGTLIKGKLPKDRTKWETAMTEEFRISPEAAKKLRMQSRSYLAMLLRPDGDPNAEPVGVLIAEHTLPGGIGPEHVELFEKSAVVPYLVGICKDACVVHDALATAKV